MPRGRPDLFLPGAEGESGLEIPITIGQMSVGGGSTGDSSTLIAGTSLQAGEVYFNYTANPLMVANPANYAGTFMTDFEGTLLAGRRLDGVVPPPPATPWSNSLPYNLAAGSVAKTGLDTDIKIFSGASLGIENIYSPNGGIGLDIFFTPSAWPPGDQLNVNIINLPAINFGVFPSFTLIFNSTPYIWNNEQITAPGYSNQTNPNAPIKTRPRPEGYNPGESGLQIFWSQLGAVTPQPAPYPVLGLFPYYQSAAGSVGVPRIEWDIGP